MSLMAALVLELLKFFVGGPKSLPPGKIGFSEGDEENSIYHAFATSFNK